MFRVSFSVFIVTAFSLLASPADAQNQGPRTPPPLTVGSAEVIKQLKAEIAELEKELADKALHNILLTDQLKSLDAEIAARGPASQDSISRIQQAVENLDESLKALERRFGSEVRSR